MCGTGRQSPPHNSRAMRPWFKLSVEILSALAGIGLTIQVAAADQANLPTVTPNSGVVTASFTVAGSFVVSKGCPVGVPAPTLTFVFFFDTPNNPIWTVSTANCQNPGVYYSGQSKPYRPPAGSILGGHRIDMQVLDAAGALLGSSANVYTITPPPPPPTTPPATRPPAPPPTHAPTPIPTPTPRCTTEGPAHNCVPVDCTHLTAAFLPFGGDGGVPPLMLLVVLLPIAGLLFRNRRLRMLSAVVFVLLVSMSCARPTSLAIAPSPTPSTHAVIGFEATPSCRGYWMASNSGGIFPFGDATGYGSLCAIQLNHPIVGMESTPDGQGYWLVASDGGVFPLGGAQGFGSTGNLHLNGPIVALEDTPDGLGYWLVASDGGVFPFGDAVGYGSTGAVHLNQPIVDMEATPDGHGYWLVARDGGIFPFGDAVGFGGTGNIQLNSAIVGMDSTPDGAGYWLVAADGGIYPFGDAAGYGSTGNVRLSSPIVGMEGTPDGHGYWLFTRDGGIFPFGDAPGYGSLGGTSI